MSWRRRMKSLPLSQIKLTGSFWRERQEQLVAVTLPHIYEQLASTSRFENFRRAAKISNGPHVGLPFDDSDVYKWLEGCAYGLTVRNSPLISSHVDEAIDLAQKAQMPDGYLNTYFQLNHPSMRWKNLGSMHEMYCAGHLFEAAAAWEECHGDGRLLDIAVKLADHILSVFGPNLRTGYCGHEEIEIGLIRLTEVTKDQKYRDFARWQIELRGHRPSPFEAEMRDPEIQVVSPWPGTLLKVGDDYEGEYSQDHLPIREHTKVVGHAVRAMYLYTAATHLADDQNDEALESALETTWANLTQRRMYITGGIGPSARNEGFTTDFDLPNLSAYAETCASIGLVFWGHQMLQLTANSDYADVIERALYNGVLSGISLKGDAFFYDNPLESRGNHQRKGWFHCACCPPNLAKVIGSVGQYVAGYQGSTFYLNIPCGLEAVIPGLDQKVKVIVEADYPWSGKAKIRVEAKTPVQLTIAVRIPDWSEEMETDLPGASSEAEYDNGYAMFTKLWSEDDALSIDFGMTPTWVEADPRVLDNAGRVALICGPLVYAAESIGGESAPHQFAVDIESVPEFDSIDNLPGVFGIEVEGWKLPAFSSAGLYQEIGSSSANPTTITMLPYAAWANRGSSFMQVWLRRG